MTRFESPENLHDDIPSLGGTSRSWTTATLLGVVVVIVGVVWAFTYFFALAGSIAFIYGGFAYGLVGMVIIAVRWNVVPRRSAERARTEVIVSDVHRFATGAQRNTLILNVLLLVDLAAFFVTRSPGDSSQLGGFIWGSIAQVAGLTLMIVNGVWAYRRRYILGEHEAMTHRVGRYRLIAANRAVSYLVWLAYTAVAGYLVFAALAPGSSVLDPIL